MEQPRQSGPSWQLAIQAFVQISGWLIGPPIAALFIGQWLDARFATKPWLFFITIGLAMVASLFGIIKEAKSLAKRLDQPSGKPPSQSA